MRSRPSFQPIGSREPRYASASIRRAPPARPGSARAFRAPPARPPAAPWQRSARSQACPRRARPRRAAPPAVPPIRSSTAPPSISSTGKDLDRAHGSHRLASVLPELEAGETADELPRLNPLGPRGQHSGDRRLHQVAPRTQPPGEVDCLLDLRLDRCVDQRLLRHRKWMHGQVAPASRVVGPDLLGDERHHRVQQRQHPLQRPEQRGRNVLIARIKARLDDLEVPVAQLRPEERSRPREPHGRSRIPPASP